MENLEFYDWIGPLITSLVAIVALWGESYKKNVVWYKRLTWSGYLIAVLLLVSVLISLKNTDVTKRENKEKLNVEQARFDSLKIKMDAVTKSKDSLTAITKKLDKDFVDATLNELKEQRRLYDENKTRILSNLLTETVFNIETYNSWLRIRKERWIKEGTPTQRFQNENLKSALLIPNENKLLTGILILKKSIDELNEGLDYVTYSEPGSKERIVNVENIFRKLDYFGKNLNALYIELKKTLPGVEIKFNTGDTTSVIW